MRLIHLNNKNTVSNFILVLLLSVGCSSLFAQGWQKNFPLEYPYKIQPALYDNISIAPTADGGSIIGFQEFLEPDTLDFDRTIKLIKVDQDGVVQWSHKLQYYTFLNTYMGDVKQTSDGGYIVSGFDGSLYARKFNQTGQVEWLNTYYSFSNEAGKTVLITPDNGYLIAGRKRDSINNLYHGYVVKTDENGLFEWDTYFGNKVYQLDEMLINPDNTYSIFCKDYEIPVGNSTIAGVLITTIDSLGNTLSSSELFDDVNNREWSTHDAVKTDDNGFLITVAEIDSLVETPMLIKTDSLGNKEWTKYLSQTAYTTILSKIVNTTNGGYMVYTSARLGNGEDENKVLKIDSLGNTEWSKEFSIKFMDLERAKDGGFLLTGFVEDNIQAIKLDENGSLYGNFLIGNVFNDSNLDCITGANEPELHNVLLEAKAGSSFYTLTDSSGNYNIEVDTGTYDLLIKTNHLWKSCTNASSIQVNQGDTITNDFPLQALVDCPYLIVDISTPFLRRCFHSRYYVSYCNQGTIASPNTFVEIDLHPHLDVTSSSIPWTSQANNTYSFLIGNLDIGQCGSFNITVVPNCDSTILGQTLCASAWISPDSICKTPSANWDGSITSLEVHCGVDSLTFTITNTGLGNMSAPQDYFVIEDNLVPRQGIFQLPSMQAMELKFPANGSTYRLYAGQAPGYFPLGYNPTIAYEGCGLNTNGTYSTGFITLYPENDILNTESVDCQEIIGSFDPNDKQAEPKGYGTEHYIEVGDDLEYHIRFQNTGTDTAFTVVIRDTLSEHLDLATLLPGTASHTYDLDIINGNILKFTFHDILLVDSFTNEPASNGFVKFKISQDTLLPLGTIIYNSAAIYFDFNEPVITNETYHEIGEDFIQIIITTDAQPLQFQQTTVKVQPNPFVDYASIILENPPQGHKTFELYDALGKLIKTEAFTDDFNHRFYKHELSKGIYFYKILNDGKLLASGKLIASH